MIVAPLHHDFLERLKQHNLDALNNPPIRLFAEGGEPLRDRFERATPGEEILLVSYSPQIHDSPYKEYGPIFVSKACQSRENFSLTTLIVDSAQDPYLSEQFVVKAYSEKEHIIDAEITSKADALAKTRDFLSRDNVAYVQLRFAAFGCYAAKSA